MLDCPKPCPNVETTFYWVACVSAVALGCATLALCMRGIKQGTVARDGGSVQEAHFCAYAQALVVWFAFAAITGVFWVMCADGADVVQSSAFFYAAVTCGSAAFILSSFSFLGTLLAHCADSAEDDECTFSMIFIELGVMLGLIVLGAVGLSSGDLPPGADGNAWRHWGDELCVDSRCVKDPTLLDACGVCMGHNSTCVGCDGIVASGMTKDLCGVCGGDGSTCASCMQVVAQRPYAITFFTGWHLVSGFVHLHLACAHKETLSCSTRRTGEIEQLDVGRLFQRIQAEDQLVVGALSVATAAFVTVMYFRCSASFDDTQSWTLCKTALWIGSVMLLGRWFHPAKVLAAYSYQPHWLGAGGRLLRNGLQTVLNFYIIGSWVPSIIFFTVSSARPAPMGVVQYSSVAAACSFVGVWCSRAFCRTKSILPANKHRADGTPDTLLAEDLLGYNNWEEYTATSVSDDRGHARHMPSLNEEEHEDN